MVFAVLGVVILLGGLATVLNLGGTAVRLGQFGRGQNEQSPLNHGVSTTGGARLWGAIMTIVGIAFIAFAVTR
jgi:hypothetical protein